MRLIFLASLLAMSFSAQAVWKGEKTTEFPATIGIVTNDLECTAVVIAPNWLLTAGHCVEGNLGASSIQVKKGNGQYQNTSVSRIYLHPKYVPGFKDAPSTKDARYDFALIHLSARTSNPTAVLIAEKSELVKAISDQSGIAVGYGRPGSKRKAVLPLVLTSSDYLEASTNKQKQSFCKGDSGGGVYVATPQGPKVIAIVSVQGFKPNAKKTRKGLCGHPQSLAVLPTIYSQKTWIENTTGIRL